MAGTMLTTTACSNEDTAIDNPTPTVGNSQTIQFTATLAPKHSDAQNRAITTGKDGENKEILSVAWAEGEKVAIYYQKTDYTYATATATVGTPNGDGSAPITATLTNAKGGTVKFVYPATLANTTGDIDEAALLSQNGNLTGANGISTKFDAATGEGTITVSGSEASVSGTVTMTNRVCICKFHFDIVDGGAVGPEREFSPVIIRDGNDHTYTITSDRAGDYYGTRGFKRSDDIYIALLPVSGKTVSFYNSSLGSGGYNNYIFTSSNTTLTAGKFYRNLSIDMVKDANTSALPFKDLTKGSVSAVDGDIIYMSSTAATANTITIADGATVTIENVNISATGSAGIICSGDATIILDGTNTVTSTADNYPAIQAGSSGTTLTIQGDGSVTATGGKYGAGIGGRYDTSSNFICGNIAINSGTVTATGGKYGAGIGGGGIGNVGWSSTCGDITISGGTVTATGGWEAAGIGSGHSYNSGYSSCGDITISGGTVTATGGQMAAAIGSGSFGKFASITITDGISSIIATSGNSYSSSILLDPIGKGRDDKGSGSVSIDGSTTWTAGTDTEHLHWTAENITAYICRWTLTHK